MSMKPYQKLIKYCRDNGIEYKANDNISVALNALNIKKEKLIAEVERSFQRVLTNLVIDTENDHNSKETAQRLQVDMMTNLRLRYSRMLNVFHN